MALHVAALPWKEIIKVIPTLVGTATRLWEQTRSQAHAAPVDPQDDPRRQLAAMLQRLEAMESAEIAQADLVRQLTEQLQGVSTGFAMLARRTTLLTIAATAALVLSIAALGMVLLHG
jgi:hypothetical protein